MIPQIEGDDRPSACQRRGQPSGVRMVEAAGRLFEDGYRVELISCGVRVASPAGKRYVVDLAEWRCDCRSFEVSQFVSKRGARWCKHLTGAPFLLLDQARAMLTEAEALECKARSVMLAQFGCAPDGQERSQWDLRQLRRGFWLRLPDGDLVVCAEVRGHRESAAALRRVAAAMEMAALENIAARRRRHDAGAVMEATVQIGGGDEALGS